MDSVPAHSNWPRVGLYLIPDDVILCILDFLESTTLAAVTLASRHLQELATPALYRNITIPQKEGGSIEHQKSAARFLRTLSRRPSLAVLVRHLENAPPLIPVHLLKEIWSEHTDLLDSQTGSAEQSKHAHPKLQIDAMKSCVNLRSLTVVGTFSVLDIIDPRQWLNFLLDSRISLKNFEVYVYPKGEVAEVMWNRFIGRVLDFQLSLEHLHFPFDNKGPAFKEKRMERWAPRLRGLGGSHVRGFNALLSNKRSIETLVIHSIPMRDIHRLCANQLKSGCTIKEVIYRGPVEDELIEFEELFGALPSLRIFRGEMWLNFSTEEVFLQELLKAFALTPQLTEFAIEDSSCSLLGFFRVAQADIFQTDLTLHEEERTRDQATWLARYSEICPKLRTFTFPDSKQWALINRQWILRVRVSRNDVL